MFFSLEAKRALWAIQKKTTVVLLIILLGSSIYRSGKITLGIMLGGLISLCNLTVLGRIIENVYSQERPNKSLVVCQYVIKLILLYVVIYFLISHNVVDAIGFVCGFSVFLLGIVIEGLFPTRYPTKN
jgi:hypothetical protein